MDFVILDVKLGFSDKLCREFLTKSSGNKKPVILQFVSWSGYGSL